MAMESYLVLADVGGGRWKDVNAAVEGLEMLAV